MFIESWEGRWPLAQRSVLPLSPFAPGNPGNPLPGAPGIQRQQKMRR